MSGTLTVAVAKVVRSSLETRQRDLVARDLEDAVAALLESAAAKRGARIWSGAPPPSRPSRDDEQGVLVVLALRSLEQQLLVRRGEVGIDGRDIDPRSIVADPTLAEACRAVLWEMRGGQAAPSPFLPGTLGHVLASPTADGLLANLVVPVSAASPHGSGQGGEGFCRIDWFGLDAMLDEVTGVRRLVFACEGSVTSRQGEVTSFLAVDVVQEEPVSLFLPSSADQVRQRLADAVRALPEEGGALAIQLVRDVRRSLLEALLPEVPADSLLGRLQRDGLSFLSPCPLRVQAEGPDGAGLTLEIVDLQLARGLTQLGSVMLRVRLAREQAHASDGDGVDVLEEELWGGDLGRHAFTRAPVDAQDPHVRALVMRWLRAWDARMHAAFDVDLSPDLMPHDLQPAMPFFALLGELVANGPPPPRPGLIALDPTRVVEAAQRLRLLGMSHDVDVASAIYAIDDYIFTFEGTGPRPDESADRITLERGEDEEVIILDTNPAHPAEKAAIDGDAPAMIALLNFLTATISVARLDDDMIFMVEDATAQGDDEPAPEVRFSEVRVPVTRWLTQPREDDDPLVDWRVQPDRISDVPWTAYPVLRDRLSPFELAEGIDLYRTFLRGYVTG